jgi:hypothetical protein
MAKGKKKRILSIQEAMDNLAAITGIDLDALPRLGIIHGKRLVTDVDEIGPYEVAWLSGEGAEPLLEILDETFQGVYYHLMTLLEGHEVNWDDSKVRQGIASMVALASDAADKMDVYLTLRLGKPLSQKIKERQSYQELTFFFHNRFAKKMAGENESWSEDWDEEKSINETASLLELSGTGLKDFEAVRRDQNYELFAIRNEDREPYFNAALLKDIKLALFEAGPEVEFEEDPLLRIRALVDRDLQASARQILSECETSITAFYKVAKKTSEINLAQALGMALTALFLASNPHNLLQNTSGKSSLQYFCDFQTNLRRAINSSDYQKLSAYPPTKEDKIPTLLLQLAHGLSRAFFTRPGGIKQEAIGFLHRCMRKGEEKEKRKLRKGETIWNQLLIDDEELRSLLKHFPNGPLFKILDVIREEEEEPRGFDPLLQGNFPQKTCTCLVQDKEVDLLRIPSPTRQMTIDKVVVAEEFRGFLRSKSKPHLMIHLQDRLSWQEQARSQCLEKLQKNAEFSGRLIVVTLPKHSDFYHQNNEYLNSTSALEFILQFKEQLAMGETAGFFFPSELKDERFREFIDGTLPLIHHTFFHGEEKLSRPSRQDFIEIFYQLLTLELLDRYHPGSMSFTCKDAIDTGAAATAAFVGFVQILDGKIESDQMHKEIDFLRWLFYMPALFIRERAIEHGVLSRAVSALSHIKESHKKEFSKLYPSHVLKGLSIQH